MLTRVLNIFQAYLAEAKPPPAYVHNENIFSSEVHSDCLLPNQRGGQTHLEWDSGLLLLPRPTPSTGDNRGPPQKKAPSPSPQWELRPDSSPSSSLPHKALKCPQLHRGTS